MASPEKKISLLRTQKFVRNYSRVQPYSPKPCL